MDGLGGKCCAKPWCPLPQNYDSGSKVSARCHVNSSRRPWKEFKSIWLCQPLIVNPNALSARHACAMTLDTGTAMWNKYDAVFVNFAAETFHAFAVLWTFQP